MPDLAQQLDHINKWPSQRSGLQLVHFGQRPKDAVNPPRPGRMGRRGNLGLSRIYAQDDERCDICGTHGIGGKRSAPAPKVVMRTPSRFTSDRWPSGEIPRSQSSRRCDNRWTILRRCTDDQGRYADAEPLFKRSLAIREKALGPNHPDVATSLNNLARLYQDQGRYADAEPLYQAIAGHPEKSLGPDHPDVATSLNNLAELYQDQGRYADAEPLYKRSLAIREKSLGPDHPDVATIAEQSCGAVPTTKVAMRMPSRSTSDRLPSGRNPSVPIIPMLRHR